MKRTFAAIAILSIALCAGCGSIFLLNIGGVTRVAATTGPAMAPEVQCAALASPKINGGAINIEAVKICESAVAEQKRRDAKR
jgi:hypothetical protein